MYVDDFAVYTFMDEVCMYIDVLHARVRVWVMRAGDSSLVVAIEDCRVGLGKTDLCEEGAEPDDVASTMSTGQILSFAGG